MGIGTWRTGWTKSVAYAIVGDPQPGFRSKFIPIVDRTMPNSLSAKKRLRQSLDRRGRNRAVRTAIRTQIRKLRTAIAAGDAEKCATEFRLAVKKLDQAAGKNILHANSAARIKSRLSKAIKAATAKAKA